MKPKSGENRHSSHLEKIYMKMLGLNQHAVDLRSLLHSLFMLAQVGSYPFQHYISIPWQKSQSSIYVLQIQLCTIVLQINELSV